MSDAQIVFRPIFRIPLTKEQVYTFIKQSESHYDDTCKAASRLGGFIYGWKNEVDFGVECITNLASREFDLLRKIMENQGILTEDEKSKQHDMFCLMNTMWRMYVDQLDSLTIDVNMGPLKVG